MTTKFLIKSILAVSAVLIMNSTAGAIVSYPLTVSGCTALKKSLGQCTVFVDGILKGLGNVTRNPTAFTATMTKMSGQVFCKNPAGNSFTANGRPFIEVEVPLTAGDTINQKQVSKNGKALSDIELHDAQIIAVLKEANPEAFPDCQNANWIQVIVITKMEIMGQQLSDPDPANTTCFLTPGPGEGFVIDHTCNIDDTLRVSCQIQPSYFDDPGAAIGNSYSYGADGTGTGACTEICHSTDETQCNLGFPVYPPPAP